MADWPHRPVQHVENHHSDSSIWLQHDWRDTDVVVATWGKAGTTLCQNLLGQIVSKGDPDYNAQSHSPWLDLRVIPNKEELKTIPTTERRIIKTHLPATAMPYNPNVKYIVVARDGRDCAFSFMNHHAQMLPHVVDMINNACPPGGVPGGPMPPYDPSIDPRTYFLRWLREDGCPLWPFFPHIRSWWEVRHFPNVLLEHFNSLRDSLVSEGKRIAAFLGEDVPEEAWPAIQQHCTIDWMRAHADKTVPVGGVGFKDGALGFLYKGTNGRWRDVLTAEDVAEYEGRALQELGPECAAWLATGSMPA